jgi:transcription initiation factor TFIIIB Brf1 subunit/transcription initiation factor TFIIB
MYYYCPECKSEEGIVTDTRQGDVICTQCGVVIHQCIMDERPLRVYDDDDVLEPSTSYNPNIGLNISKNRALQKTQQRSSPNQPKHQQRIMELCDRFAYGVSSVPSIALEIFSKAAPVINRANTTIYAACIYLAYTEISAPRTLKEICAVIGEGVHWKQVKNWAHKIHQSSATGSVTTKTNHISLEEKCIPRWCSVLGMDRSHIIECKKIIRAMSSSQHKQWQGRNFPSRAAGAIWHVIVSHRLNDKLTMQDVANSCNIAMLTVKASYTEIVSNVHAPSPKS